MRRWPLLIAIVAASAGTAMLVAWFGSYWPATRWTVLSSDRLVSKAREITQHFGVNTNDWKVYQVADVARPLAHYESEHPLAASPLTLRLTFVARQGSKAAEVGLDSSGRLVYWRPPASYKPAKPFASDEDAASDSFRFLAGAEAANYTGPVRTMGDKEHEQNYVWRSIALPKVQARQKIEVVTQDKVVRKLRASTYFPFEGDDSDDNYGQDYWDIIGPVYGLLCTVGVVVILSIYVLWLVRKSISHKFPIRVALAALLAMSAALVFGVPWQRMKSVNLDEGLPVLGTLCLTGMVLCFVAVGRGISETFRPKWMSLEQLAGLAPLSKSVGQSLAGGLLFSPLLVAVPFLIVGCGLFPHSWVLPHNAAAFYSHAPMLDSLKIPDDLCLLGFFGFAIPVFQRFIPFRWLLWVFVIPVGVVFFADWIRVVSGPIAAPLTAGVLTLALFWLVWAYFDVLALLTLHIASGWLLATLMLAQKGHWSFTLVAALAGLIAASVWCYSRGQALSQGDSLASVPALKGFRAEREKLRAEFSVARRAQQDMLPHTPPVIPGYTIAASCTPSLEVGGDLYDFLKLPDGRIGIGVADVSGKGVPAALYMTLTKGLLASVTKDSSDLPVVLEEVNRHLHGVTRKRVFVTMAMGFLDAENQVLECVRAGHNPVVWRQTSQNATSLVSPGGIGLGITAGRVFASQLKVEKMLLHEGDAVVFYSDGITEAMNSELEQFGEQRLMDAVQKTDTLDAAAAHDSILAEVRGFLAGVHPQDDMTLVVLRVGVRGLLERG